MLYGSSHYLSSHIAHGLRSNLYCQHFNHKLRVKKGFGDASFDSNDNLKIVIEYLMTKLFIAINC